MTISQTAEKKQAGMHEIHDSMIRAMGDQFTALFGLRHDFKLPGRLAMSAQAAINWVLSAG